LIVAFASNAQPNEPLLEEYVAVEIPEIVVGEETFTPPPFMPKAYPQHFIDPLERVAQAPLP
jgi:hypothetical protein